MIDAADMRAGAPSIPALATSPCTRKKFLSVILKKPIQNLYLGDES